MINHNNSELNALLKHVHEQRVRAKLVDQPFELGIMSDENPSWVLDLVRDKDTEKLLKASGMVSYNWYDDALRSNIRIADEEIMVSVCKPR